jgi:hypothetical protein
MGICLEEIRRCRQVSPALNFLVLLGDRYGWKPIPADMNATRSATLPLVTRMFSLGQLVISLSLA